jgi:ABC-type proline/glycine betaine transport system permease subunit
VVATAVALVLAVLVGTLTAKQRRWVRSTTTGSELLLASMPTFVLGLVLLLVFSIGLSWFPVSPDPCGPPLRLRGSGHRPRRRPRHGDPAPCAAQRGRTAGVLATIGIGTAIVSVRR